ncbi:MAG: pirin family protein [Legionellales bacterium]|nr:pirin family protein [Legionellales bacterium]
MISIRKARARGCTQTNWLTSFHTFSFADYYDPAQMGFKHLRVINEDTVEPDNGFGKHPHQNMEIISYVIEGALAHKDSMGTGSVIHQGEIQRMSAGIGVEHSEFNPSKTEKVHFLQIWLIPEQKNIKPEYEQKALPSVQNELILIGARQGGEHTVIIHQDVKLYKANLMQGQRIEYKFESDRCGWLQLIKGKIQLNGQELSPGDGAGIQNEKKIQLTGLENAELLLFDQKE